MLCENYGASWFHSKLCCDVCMQASFENSCRIVLYECFVSRFATKDVGQITVPEVTFGVVLRRNESNLQGLGYFEITRLRWRPPRSF